jgi:serine protease inhibitor
MKKRIHFLLSVIVFSAVIITLTTCNDSDLDSNFDQIILSNQDEVLIKSANNLGFDLIKISQFSKPDDNILISPLELASNLNLLLNGSAGNTFDYINSYINPSNLSINEINNSYKRILEAVQNLSDDKFFMLNGFWFKNGSGVDSHFKNISSYFYKTYIDSINFTNSSDFDRISNWVNSNSRTEFSFSSVNMDSQTQSILINIFESNLKFKYLFKSRTTGSFYISDNDSVAVPMLNVSASYKLFSNNYFSLIEIPYTNSSFSLLILLPNQNMSLQTILPLINSANWDLWIKSFTKTTVNLSLPEMNLSECLELGKYIRNSSFDFLLSESVDYSLVAANRDFDINYLFSYSKFNIRDNDLSISKTKINATEVSIESTNFQVNKPFLFAIKENSSNLVLLSGIIKKPTQN